MRGWIVKLLVLGVMAGITVVGILEPPNPFYVPPAQAAAPTGGSDELATCPAVGKAGNVIVYQCETDSGLLYVNSVGFMWSGQ